MVDILEMQKWAFIPLPPEDIASMRDLLANYSQIPAQDITAHLIRVRDKAWASSRAPFIGRWKFLRLSEANDPCYKQVLFRLTLCQSRDALLDLGCGFGQALRQLRASNVPPSRLYGVDADPLPIAFGYDLFRDRGSLGAKLLVGDVLDPHDQRLRELRGKVTIVHAGSFFHLFTWDEQLRIGRRVVDEFLKPGTQNAVVYGNFAGSGSGSGSGSRTATVGRSPYLLHDKGSLQRLWDEVGECTGTRWRVEVDVADGDSAAAAAAAAAQLTLFPRDVKAMNFTIFQVP